MNESGQVYNYNKLRTLRTLTDIISQCIVAFAFSAFVILGLTNKSDSYIIATLLMAVPVIITYAARKNIHKNFLFMLIHAALLITAIIIGNGDAESTAYFVSPDTTMTIIMLIPVILSAGNSDLPALLINRELSSFNWLARKASRTNSTNNTVS
jgi:hypothetical protein